MKKDSLAFALSGTAFGLLAGWIIGAQQVPQAPPAPAAPVAQQAAPAQQSAPPPLDQARVTALQQQISAEPRNAALRVELANLFFDSERFAEAQPWYESALELDPKNISASTDLAIAYFYQGQADRALAQLDRSLAIDPNHVKSLLNQGIVRARGKQDMAGAVESWERVVSVAPDSEEARLARMGLEGIKSVMQPQTPQGTGAP